MKLTRTSWIFILVGIVVIVFVGLGVAFAQQSKERRSLDAELRGVEVRLKEVGVEQLISQEAALKQGLSQASAGFDSAKSKFSNSTSSIAVSDTVFAAATANGVTVLDYSSSAPTTGKIETVNALTLPVTARVEGSVTALINFIDRLNHEFPTGLIKSVDVNMPEGGGEKASAELRLVIYSYQGN